MSFNTLSGSFIAILSSSSLEKESSFPISAFGDLKNFSFSRKTASFLG
jgi:hypothetical protein